MTVQPPGPLRQSTISHMYSPLDLTMIPYTKEGRHVPAAYSLRQSMTKWGLGHVWLSKSTKNGGCGMCRCYTISIMTNQAGMHIKGGPRLPTDSAKKTLPFFNYHSLLSQFGSHNPIHLSQPVIKHEVHRRCLLLLRRRLGCRR